MLMSDHFDGRENIFVALLRTHQNVGSTLLTIPKQWADRSEGSSPLVKQINVDKNLTCGILEVITAPSFSPVVVLSSLQKKGTLLTC